MKTRRQLIDKALENLGVIASGEAPANEDISKIDDYIDPMLDMAAADGLPVVNDAGSPVAVGGSIDNQYFLSYAAMLSNEAKASYGLTGDASYYVLAQQAEDKLRRLSARTRKRLKVDSILNRGARLYGWRWF